jgi:hypothetical protein
MPKLNQLVNNMVSDKEERAEQCFDYLREKKIEICNLETKAIVQSVTQLRHIGIERYSEGDFYKYCITQFQNKGFIPCNEIPSPKVETKAMEPIFIGNIYQAKTGVADVIKVPNTKETTTISIGKTTKASGKETGCKFIIQNFNKGDLDIIDLSAFKGTTYDDLYFSTITMNGLATKAIHIADVSPEHLICLYNYNEDLNQSNFQLSGEQFLTNNDL